MGRDSRNVRVRKQRWFVRSVMATLALVLTGCAVSRPGMVSPGTADRWPSGRDREVISGLGISSVSQVEADLLAVHSVAGQATGHQGLVSVLRSDFAASEVGINGRKRLDWTNVLVASQLDSVSFRHRNMITIPPGNRWVEGGIHHSLAVLDKRRYLTALEDDFQEDRRNYERSVGRLADEQDPLRKAVMFGRADSHFEQMMDTLTELRGFALSIGVTVTDEAPRLLGAHEELARASREAARTLRCNFSVEGGTPGLRHAVTRELLAILSGAGIPVNDQPCGSAPYCLEVRLETTVERGILGGYFHDIRLHGAWRCKTAIGRAPGPWSCRLLRIRSEWPDLDPEGIPANILQTEGQKTEFRQLFLASILG